MREFVQGLDFSRVRRHTDQWLGALSSLSNDEYRSLWSDQLVTSRDGKYATRQLRSHKTTYDPHTRSRPPEKFQLEQSDR